MARPNTVRDLSDQDVTTTKIAQIDFEALAKLRNAEITLAFHRLLEVCDEYGFEYKDSYGGMEVRAHLTSSELQKKLESVQAEWDANLKRYMAALKNPSDPTQGHYEYPSLRRALNTWAVNEGFEPIDWSVREDSEADGSAVN